MSAFSASNFLGDTGAIPGAAQWIEAILLGSLGGVLAVIAVACVGLAMLWGRISIRSGVQVVLGCFILFGAPMLARSFMDLARAGPQPEIIAIPALPQLPVPPPRPPVNADPYAGASVPM
jgi:type IV secretory pathway VirB2 component (pilin)